MLKKEIISFSVSPENKEFAESAWESVDGRYSSKSHWVNELFTHLRNKVVDKPKVKRSKPKVYPSNLDEQFNLLWCAKGKRGPKQKALDKFKPMMEGQSKAVCQELVTLLVSHIESMCDEIGFRELHLTTYINQKRWES